MQISCVEKLDFNAQRIPLILLPFRPLSDSTMPQIGGRGRTARGPSRSQQLAEKATKKAVRPVLGLRYYYRSADMLIKQADSYRQQKNEDELYVMLMRFVSLVVETIPEHDDFRKGVDPQYRRLKVYPSRLFPYHRPSSPLLCPAPFASAFSSPRMPAPAAPPLSLLCDAVPVLST